MDEKKTLWLTSDLIPLIGISFFDCLKINEIFFIAASLWPVKQIVKDVMKIRFTEIKRRSLSLLRRNYNWLLFQKSKFLQPEADFWVIEFWMKINCALLHIYRNWTSSHNLHLNLIQLRKNSNFIHTFSHAISVGRKRVNWRLHKSLLNCHQNQNSFCWRFLILHNFYVWLESI